MNKLYLLFGLCILLLPLVSASSYCDNLFCYSDLNGNPLKYVNEYGVVGNLTNSGAVYNNTAQNYGFNKTNYLYRNAFTYNNQQGTICTYIYPLSWDTVIVTLSNSDYANSIRVLINSLGKPYINYIALNQQKPTPVGAIANKNEWSFWCFTWNNNTPRIESWYNGVTNSAFTSYFNITNNNSGIITIANFWSGLTQTFNGSIDNFMIFNRSLSASEVLENYNRGRGGSPVNMTGLVLWSSFTNNSIVSGYSNTILWCSKDDYLTALGTGTLYGYKGNNLTNNGAVYNSTEGNYMFNGSNVLLSPVSTQLSNFTNSGLTYSVWIYPTSNSTRMRPLQCGSNNYFTYFWGGAGQNVYCIVLNSTGAESIDVYPFLYSKLNTWSQITCRYNTTHIEACVNGICSGSATSVSGRLKETTNFLIIGAAQTSGYEGINGSIDNVAVWNRSLSADEIYQNYLRGINGLPINNTGLVDRWSFTNGTPLNPILDVIYSSYCNATACYYLNGSIVGG
jgi:hypothetical protein